MHWGRWRKHGDPLHVTPWSPPPQNRPRTFGCKVVGCEAKHFAKGCCKIHYQREYHRATVDERKAAQSAYRSDPVHQAKARAIAKAWREANPERASATGRAWRAANKDREREARRAYREANRDAVRALNNRRKALQRNVEISDLTAKQWVAIVASFGSRCVYCGCTPDRITMDHVIPLSKGGNHTASNVVPACGPCNFTKKDGPAPPFVIEPAA